MSALTDALVDVLNRLTQRPDAVRCWIFFYRGRKHLLEDEMPDGEAKSKFSAAERKMVDRLFEIRRKIWRGAELSPEDEAFWEAGAIGGSRLGIISTALTLR